MLVLAEDAGFEALETEVLFIHGSGMMLVKPSAFYHADVTWRNSL